MRTVTKIVRAVGAKSVFESIELKAAADLASATAEIRARLEKLEAALPLKADAEHLATLAAQRVQHVVTAMATDADHAARLAELEARAIDQAAMSVTKRVWAWLTRWDGWV